MIWQHRYNEQESFVHTILSEPIYICSCVAIGGGGGIIRGDTCCLNVPVEHWGKWWWQQTGIKTAEVVGANDEDVS